MPDRPPPDRSPATPDVEQAAAAQQHSSWLAERLARVADAVADSEEKVARTYEDSARLRPHAAERLQDAAREARSFAARERRQSRRLRSPPPDGRLPRPRDGQPHRMTEQSSRSDDPREHGSQRGEAAPEASSPLVDADTEQTDDEGRGVEEDVRDNADLDG